METLKNNLIEFKSNFKQLPLDIKSIFWFSLFLLIGGRLLNLSSFKEWYLAVIPYTSWSPGYNYIWILFPIVLFTLSKTNKTKMGNLDLMRVYIVVFLGIFMIEGICFWYLAEADDRYNPNPYLRYEPLQAVYGVIIPLFWILIIGWPLMKNFLNKKSKASA